MSYVDTSGDCWIWTGSRSTAGYGRVYLDRGMHQAHRVVYEMHVGPVPARLDLDHECHNRDTSCLGGPTCRHRPCVNPEHLVPRARRANLLRGRGIASEKAERTHCEHGHEFTAENTYLWKNARWCRACRRDAEARRPGRPERIVKEDCVMCGASFEFVRRRGEPPNVCSDNCRADRKRRTARDSQRRRRAGPTT